MAYTTDFTNELVALVNDLTSAEKTQYSNLLFNKYLMASDISQSHTIVTGIRHGNVIPIIKDANNVDAFPSTDKNSCDIPLCDTTGGYTSHTWELTLAECRNAICLREFDEDFLLFWNQFKINEPNPNLQTALLQYIYGKVLDNLKWAHWRHTYFGDTASGDARINGINGFFAQMEAQAGTNPEQRVIISENAGATFADQKNIDGKAIYDYLVAMDDLYSETEWYDTAPVAFYMSRLTAQKLVNYLNGLTETEAQCCNGIERVNPDGLLSRTWNLDNMRFRGIPIVVRKEWSEIINKSDLFNGGGRNAARINPHRIVLTYQNNLLIGTSEIDKLNMFDVFYDRTDRKIYIDAGTYIGAGVPLKDEFIIAY